MGKDRIEQIERYMIQVMDTVAAPELKIAHDFKHVDRVRGWMLQIASGEAFPDMDVAEAAALLHDIGLARVSIKQRDQHGQAGAEMSAKFPRENQLFSDEEVEIIVDAVRCHNTPRGGGRLGEMLRDADKLDGMGAVGIMRALTSKSAKSEYPPQNIKGETWEMPMEAFEKRFAEGKGIGDYIVDQLNFQITFYEELHTDTARRLGKPLVEFTKAYVLQLDAEIAATRMDKQ